MAVQKHKDGWRVVVYAGKSADHLPPPHTSKPRLTRVVRTSHADAKALDREWQEMVKAHRSGPANRTTAKDFLPEFLNLAKKGTTRQTYDFALRAFVSDHGDKPMDDWTEREARRVAATLPKGNVIVVKTFFARAVERGVIDRSPFAQIAPSTGRQMRTKADFHSLWPLDAADQRTQFNTIVAAALEDFGPAEAALVAWQGWTGCRPGESFVLRRANLNLATDTATLRANYDRSIGAESTTGTKNHLHREIVVPPAPELRELLANLPVYLTSPYVFTNGGNPWSPSAWHSRWKEIRKTAGHPRMRFYDLRHFCATQLLELGVTSEDVAIQLGHTDGGELVRTVYGHPSEDAARDRIRNTLARGVATDQHTDMHTINQRRA